MKRVVEFPNGRRYILKGKPKIVVITEEEKREAIKSAIRCGFIKNGDTIGEIKW